MPVATLDDGVQFYYEDSGAGLGSYLTIVLVHGTAYTAGIFRRMMPIAVANNIRLVAMNRRDYPGTSPYSPEELAALSSDDIQVREKALQQTGLHFGAFLSWFIRTHNTPPIAQASGEKCGGGVSLVAWSLGHSSTASLIAFPEKLSEEEYRLLDAHLRSYCALEVPGASFGLPPLTTYHPLTEEAVPMSERMPRFEQWISAYYNHGEEALSTHNANLLDVSPLPYPTPDDRADRPPTLLAMDPETKASFSWPAPIATSELYLFMAPPAVVFGHTRRAILNEATAKSLPRCKFVLLYSGCGSWPSISGAWEIEKLRKEYDAKGQSARPFELVEMPWANHFPHWDDPEKTVKLLISVC